MNPQIGNVPEFASAVWKRRLTWTLLIIGGVLFALWVISATVDLTIWGAYNHYIDTLSDRLRINTYLANVLSILFVVPFFLGIRYYLFSLSERKKKQRIGLTMLLSMGALYNLALYSGTRNENFGPKGAVKFYALIPGGVVFSDRPGTEPKYGIPFRPVSKENIRWLLRIQNGRIQAVSDPANHDWFDAVTGDPLLWQYADSNGALRFFDGPGRSPATGAELKPVTPEIRDQWEKTMRAATATQTAATATQTNIDSSPKSSDFIKGVLAASKPQPEGSRIPTELDAENSTTSSTISASQPLATMEMDDIVFAVSSCRASGNALQCNLQFTNKDRDRDMRLGGQFGGTRIIDQSGRESVVEVLQLGAKECRGCAVVNRLVNDVPMSAGLSRLRKNPS